MFLLGWEKGFRGKEGENMCLHRSSLLLPVCGLRANAYEDSVSQLKLFAFKGLSKKGEKAQGVCTQNRGILLIVCTVCLQLGDAERERRYCSVT